MKVVKFITYSEAEDKEENRLGGLGGWFDHGMRWKDYINRFKPEAHEELEKLRDAIIEHGIRYTGEEHQHTDIETVPLWSNGTVDTYSYRAWGDLYRSPCNNNLYLLQ